MTRPATDAGTRGRPDAAGAPSAQRQLLYVAGYGRSGSTMLGLALAQDDRVLDLGEAVFVPGFLKDRKRPCTCRKSVAKCWLWRRVPPVTPGSEKEMHRQLLESIIRKTRYPFILDTSKTAHQRALRPLYLARRLSVRIYVIHLFRDPRAILWSILRECRRSGMSLSVWLQVRTAFKTATGWTIANLAAEMFRLAHPRDYVRVCYDEMVEVGLPPALDFVVPHGPLQGRVLTSRRANHHAVVGNRMRRQETIAVALDDEWRNELHPFAAALMIALCFPLALHYGLLRRRAA